MPFSAYETTGQHLSSAVFTDTTGTWVTAELPPVTLDGVQTGNGATSISCMSNGSCELVGYDLIATANGSTTGGVITQLPPALPEAPLALALPLAAGVVVAGGLAATRRRRIRRSAAS